MPLPISTDHGPALHAGGCLCGATRYETTTPARGTTYCHCSDCRRASGAPVVAWTFFTTPGLRWTGARPRVLEWAGRERTFCPLCGSPLTFFDSALPHQFEVTTCTLDDPDSVPPVDHNWICDRLPWFDTRDSLPRFEHGTPLPPAPTSILAKPSSER